MRPPIARLARLLLVLGAPSCTLEIPPGVPGPPSAGTLVVPDARTAESRERDGYGATPLDCSVHCPTREPAHLEACHPTQVAPLVARHRSHLGEPLTPWVVCYYEAD